MSLGAIRRLRRVYGYYYRSSIALVRREHAMLGPATAPWRRLAAQAAHGRCRARKPMTWLPLNVVIVDNDRGDSPRSYRARALIGLVLRRCPEIPPEHMQGGSRCPGPAVEPERARWGMTRCYLDRWLGLTPERPALCLRGFPGRPRVALSRVSDPPGLGRR